MMRSTVFAVVCVGVVTATACSQQGPTFQSGSGGSDKSGGGSTGQGGQNSGGSTSMGGAVSTGGNVGNGGMGAGGSSGAGSNKAAGGNGGDASGGASSAGGTAAGGSDAGVARTGGSNAGGANTGGSTAAGGATTAVGSGGATAMGGATAPTTGDGGATGTGGSTGAGGSSAALTPADIVPDLDGLYWEASASGNATLSTNNYPFSESTGCPNATASSWDQKGEIKDKTLTAKGTTGTQYTVNFEVRGVVGTRCYTGGTPAVANMTPSDSGPNNTWYVGGRQANDSIWNTYELHVSPAVTGEANVYFFNGFPNTGGWCEKEATYEVKYSASFKVLGGGTMKFTVHDSNCNAKQNCGSNDKATTCEAPRKIDLSGMSPAATITQPVTNSVGGKTYYPQWLYFDVKSVTSP